ncbi:hypothetical protein SAQ01S_25960 [Sphingomonas aquatilis NBRC 16722]|uniref:Pyrroline-5-carboxylate reductase catalytic N-terminal domain-containing protein n=2 Tax=Sphingomonas aquatilis TaxID=93063 RepID=A0AAW3TWL2_9SPHN|nr:NADPH-dependent F420 reductase [Sphingomonas aquatilis]MBB3876992.1 hypothetical protein [Sphingomonas aquatilis]GEM72830.1 hypothetical protein SAQ01S_25960 [Sphingomonas aquatilis NBRC 16722]
MRIGVIGAGWLGSTVGRLWVEAGHEVLFSSRTPSKLEELTAELGDNAIAGSFLDAAEFGEVALLSVRYPALPSLVMQVGDALAGRIVLDACNPFPPDRAEVIAAVEAAGVARTTQRHLPRARLVRAFSSVDADEIAVSAERRHGGRPLGVPLVSDDVEAMAVAEDLVRDCGCDPLNLGTMAHARIIENGEAGFRLHANVDGLRSILMRA